MKFEQTGQIGMNVEHTMGFVAITELGNAQQVTVSVERLMHIGRLAEVLGKLGFEDITVTVETDMPIVLGGKSSGIGIAPVITED